MTSQMPSQPATPGGTMPTQQPTADQDRATRRHANLLGLYLALLGLFFFAETVVLWPEVVNSAYAGGRFEILFTWGDFAPGLEAQLIMLVMTIGALGSMVHALTSYIDFVGNRRFGRSWTGWYVLRPLVGGALALVFYFAVRGGFLSGGATSTGAINPYGIATLAALAGMFSKQATDKLSEVFCTMFKVSEESGDAKRDGKLADGPKITALEPAEIPTSNSEELPVLVKGTGFTHDMVVRLNGHDRLTRVKSAELLEVVVVPASREVAGEVAVTVFDPASRRTSEPMALRVVEAGKEAKRKTGDESINLSERTDDAIAGK